MNQEIKFYKNKIFKEIERLGPFIIKLSDWLADNPELSGYEYNISQKIADLLEKNNFEVVNSFMNIPTAIKGTIKGIGNKKVAFLAEYDALPDVGHGCGHNVSGCISLLAALAFSRVIESIKGELSIFGTPDEEARGSKIEMSNKGAFDDYDFSMMIHMSNDNMVVKKFVALDAVEFTFTGKSAHAGSSPWLGINALNGAQLFFHAIDMLRQHVRPDARMHGIILEGGLGPTPNIVPDKAVVRFHFRTHNRKYLNEVMKKVFDCANGAAIATQTKVTHKYYEPKADEILRNKKAEKMVEIIYREIGIDIDDEDDVDTISSDVFRVSQKCPTIHSYLAICNKDKNLHTKEFADATKSNEAHKAIVNGAKILVLSALNIFHDEKASEEIKNEFLKNKDDF